MQRALRTMFTFWAVTMMLCLVGSVACDWWSKGLLISSHAAGHVTFYLQNPLHDNNELTFTLIASTPSILLLEVSKLCTVFGTKENMCAHHKAHKTKSS